MTRRKTCSDVGKYNRFVPDSTEINIAISKFSKAAAVNQKLHSLMSLSLNSLLKCAGRWGIESADVPLKFLFNLKWDLNKPFALTM